MLAKSSLRRSCRAARLSVVGFASFAAVVLMASSPVRAQDYWTLSPSQSADWSSAANWSAGVPTSSDMAYVVNGGTATVTSMNATCGTLSLGSTDGSGAVQMTGGSCRSSFNGALLLQRLSKSNPNHLQNLIHLYDAPAPSRANFRNQVLG